MAPMPYFGGLPFDARIVSEVTAILRERWDADGVLLAAAATSNSSDPTAPRTYEDFALAIAGILGAGGSEAEVSGYLRREEERLLGSARSTGQIRWEIASDSWRAVRGISLPRQEG